MKILAFFETGYQAGGDDLWRRLELARPASRRLFPLGQPSTLGTYDLADPGQAEAVVALARNAGIDGFVIDCRWQDGAYRHDAALLAPFCRDGFGLALLWHNGDEPIWAEPLLSEPMLARAEALADCLSAVPAQPVGGGLALIVESPKQWRAAARVTGILRQAADRSGVGALTLIANRAEDKGRFVEQGFDALIDPPPDQWHSCQPSNHATGLDFLEVLGGLRDSTDYLDRYFAYLDFTVSRMLNRSQRGRVLPRVFPAFHDWLAHPGGGATQLVNRSNRPADAQLYGMFLENAMLFTERHFPAGDQVVFLHSWNKWQDGSQIEPSQWDGDMLWNATRDAIDRGRYQIKCKSNVMPAQNAARRDTIAMMCDAARQTLKQT